MNLRRLHMPSLGVFFLVFGGLLRLISGLLEWPLLLVLLSQIMLVLSIGWIIVYDVFPIFLHPFYILRQRYPRRYSFFFALLCFFAVMQLISLFLPSGHTKDATVSLAFLSFLSAILWFSVITVISAFTPLIKHWKYTPRQAEKVTFSDIITSMAVILSPTIVLSFFFVQPGLARNEVTPHQVFVTTFLTDIVIVLYIYLMVIRARIFTWKQIGVRKFSREDLAQAFVPFLFVVVVAAILQALLQRLGLPLQRFSFSTREGALFAFLVTVFLTPLAEELYFRGYLFKGLLLNYRPIIAYIVPALLFALLHPPLLAMVEVFAIGLLLAYLVRQTKSIWPGMVIHMLNNAIVFGYLLYR